MTFKMRTYTLSWYSCRIFSKPQRVTWLWEWVETPLGWWSEQQYCRCWSFVLFFNAVTMLESVNTHRLYYAINFTDILFQNYLYTVWHRKRDVNTVYEYSNTPSITIQWLTENGGMAYLCMYIFFVLISIGCWFRCSVSTVLWLYSNIPTVGWLKKIIYLICYQKLEIQEEKTFWDHMLQVSWILGIKKKDKLWCTPPRVV